MLFGSSTYYLEDRSKDFIKRIIGVPGDEIVVRDKQVLVNGALYRKPHDVHKESQLLPQEVLGGSSFIRSINARAQAVV